jgi:hypothetical protein
MYCPFFIIAISFYFLSVQGSSLVFFLSPQIISFAFDASHISFFIFSFFLLPFCDWQLSYFFSSSSNSSFWISCMSCLFFNCSLLLLPFCVSGFSYFSLFLLKYFHMPSMHVMSLFLIAIYFYFLSMPDSSLIFFLPSRIV